MVGPKKTASTVVWELSEEGRVVVDVDAPLRPFGALPTPPKGIFVAQTDPDMRAFEEMTTDVDVEAPPRAPKPTR
jgi:hypothetical protein